MAFRISNGISVALASPSLSAATLTMDLNGDADYTDIQWVAVQWPRAPKPNTHRMKPVRTRGVPARKAATKHVNLLGN